MVRQKVRETEKRVLDNYLKHSPSKLPIEDNSYREKHIAKRTILFKDLLKLPPRIFSGAKVLDFGCGTGEQSFIYAMWGAKCTLVDMNPVSTLQAQKYFEMFGLGGSLEGVLNESIFDFKSSQDYDIVICEGVLHHTDDPQRGFEVASNYLKKDGFIVLQIAFDTSHFQRSLQRLILDHLTDGKEDKIVSISKKLFKEQLERSHKLGGRSIEQIVYDFYTNPKHKGISIFEILNWFKKQNIKYYSSYPMIEMEGLINGIHKASISALIENYPFLLLFTNFLFMIAKEDDEENLLNYKEKGETNLRLTDNLFEISMLRDYEYGSKVDLEMLLNIFNQYMSSVRDLFESREQILLDKVDTFKTEVNNLVHSLETKDVSRVKESIENFSILFKGYNGVPSNYIVGYKI